MAKKVAYTIVRILLGLSWIFFGAGKFLPAQEVVLPGPALDFLGAMGATGYMIPFVGIAELLVGLMLLTNRWVPLSTVIWAPVMLNVILFNIFLAPSISGAVMLLILTILHIYIIKATWNSYKPLLKSKSD
ncbi:MAG: DoxX protein [Candidatus Pacearchaeota archaeon]